MNKIVNGVANDYEFPQLDWVHHDSTTIKMPNDEETTNLAKAIWDYFPLLVEENKTLKQELQVKDNEIKQLQEDIVNHIKIASEYKEQMIIKDNIIKDAKEVLLTTNNIEKALNVLDRTKELEESK